MEFVAKYFPIYLLELEWTRRVKKMEIFFNVVNEREALNSPVWEEFRVFGFFFFL